MDVPLSPKSRYRWVRSVSVARRSVKQRHSCKAEYGIFSSATRYWTSASFAGWLRWRKAPPFPFVSMRSNKWMPPRKLRRSLKSSLEHWWKSTWECGDVAKIYRSAPRPEISWLAGIRRKSATCEEIRGSRKSDRSRRNRSPPEYRRNQTGRLAVPSHYYI